MSIVAIVGFTYWQMFKLAAFRERMLKCKDILFLLLDHNRRYSNFIENLPAMHY